MTIGDMIRSLLSKAYETVTTIVGVHTLNAPDDAIKGRMAYQYNGWVSTCVNAAAEAVAAVPLKVYLRKTNSDGEVEREEVAEEHPLRVLLSRPNKYMTGAMFWRSHQTELELMGNALWLLRRNPVRKTVDQIISVKWEDISPVLTDDKQDIVHYIWRSAGQHLIVPVEDVLHFRSANPFEQWFGMSLGEKLVNPLMTQWYIDEWNKTFFKDGAIPAGLLTTDHNIGPEDAEEARKRWRKQHSGSNNWHDIAVMGKGVKFEKVSEGRKDMGYEMLYRLTREEILAVTGTPPVIAGIMEYANYANADAQIRLYYELKILSALRYNESVINEMMVPREFKGEKGLFVEYDTSGVAQLQPDKDKQATRRKIYIDSGFKTINELRREDNLPDVEWGDEPPAAAPSLGGLLSGDAPPRFKMKEPPTLSPEDAKFMKALDEKLSMRTSKFAGMARDFFLDQKKRLLEAIEERYQLSMPVAQRDIDPKKVVVTDEIMELFVVLKEMQLMTDAATPMMEYIVGLSGQEALQLVGVAAEFNMANPRVIEYIENKTLNLVTTVNQSSKDLLRGMLSHAAEEGMSIQAVTKDIGGLFNGFADYRAKRIAQTEVIASHNAGSLEGYKQSDVVEGKKWLTTGGADTPRHELVAGLDGQIVDLDSPFDVEGYLMMYPGDPAGPAEHVINCHCGIVPVLKED